MNKEKLLQKCCKHDVEYNTFEFEGTGGNEEWISELFYTNELYYFILNSENNLYT